MDEPITRAEHTEFVKRMEDENHRQNRRITKVEDDVRDLQQLTANVARIAESNEKMVDEMGKQGKRLDALESKPAENWYTVIKSILTGIGAAIAVAVVAVIANNIVK